MDVLSFSNCSCNVVCISIDEVVQALNEMKTGNDLDLHMYHWSSLLLEGE